MKHKLALIITIFIILPVFIGCSERVPAGHYGMVLTASGWKQGVLPPGNHTCFWRDRLYLLEISEDTYVIKLKILCKDNLNFSFNLNIRCKVDISNKEQVKSAFEKITPRKKGEEKKIAGVITSQQLFDIFVKPVADPIAREVVGKRETTEIGDQRETIKTELNKKIKEALKGSLMKIDLVTASNLDFPDVVTKAQEKRAEKQVEIETEKAEQEKRLLIAKNKYKVESWEYKRKLLEATSVRDYNLIVGSGISEKFLAYHYIKVLSDAANGPNNWGFMLPYDYKNLSGSFSAKNLQELPITHELLEKMAQMRKDVDKLQIPEEEEKKIQEKPEEKQPPAEQPKEKPKKASEPK